MLEPGTLTMLLKKMLCNCKIERSCIYKVIIRKNMLETRSPSLSDTYRCPPNLRYFISEPSSKCYPSISAYSNPPILLFWFPGVDTLLPTSTEELVTLPFMFSNWNAVIYMHGKGPSHAGWAPKHVKKTHRLSQESFHRAHTVLNCSILI